MIRRSVASLAAAGAFWLIAAPAFAEDELDAGRVIAVERRPFRMIHEFSGFVGILPIDALYTGYSLGGSYTLHLSDLLAWEIINFHYSANVDSGLETTLARRWEVAPTNDPRIQYLATTHITLSPLFGKFALFNESILYAETYLSLGGGLSRFDDGFRPTLSGGPGIRVYFGQRVSSRLDVRSMLVPDFPSGLDHVLQITLGVSFNFGSIRATETETAVERDETDGLDTLDELYPASNPERAKEKQAK